MELLDICWNRQWPELCSCLERSVPVDWSDDSGLTPLQICSALGWAEAVSRLLEHGADVHKSSSLGWTALMQAVRNGHTRIVTMLLDAGAKTTDVNLLGWDCMSLAIASQNEDMVTILIPIAKACQLNSALVVACQLGHKKAVKFLLKQGVDVNIKLPETGLTPLMLAVCGGNAQVVKILLSKGADPHLTNSFQMTASDMALSCGHTDIADILNNLKSNRLQIPSPFPLPLLNVSSTQVVLTCHGYYQRSPLSCTCSPMYTPLHVQGHGQVFNFSPSHSCISASLNGGSCVPSSLPLPSSSIHCVPACNPTSPVHNDLYCHSPFPHPSMLSPSMFAYRKRSHKMEPKSDLKSKKPVNSWWKTLKRRYKTRKLKKKVKAYMSLDRREKVVADRELEELLHSLSLEYIFPLMISHEIDIETFLNLRDVDLEELGIADKFLQTSILQKIHSLNGNIFK